MFSSNYSSQFGQETLNCQEKDENKPTNLPENLPQEKNPKFNLFTHHFYWTSIVSKNKL